MQEVNEGISLSQTQPSLLIGVVVQPKWRGTSQDKHDMEVLGRHQVLRVRGSVYLSKEPFAEKYYQRNFRFVSMLAFNSVLIVTWEILLALVISRELVWPMSNIDRRDTLFVTIDGGTADLFWGYIVVFMGTSLTYASLAEMASM
ncbi:MAG: hypothetical protein L6R37_007746 [Teloschistes peruensis]|nr:MAG: hypothetical protein L6R37_007746 [Teloschistes peruensis]